MAKNYDNPVLATMHMLNDKLKVRRPPKLVEFQEELERRGESTYSTNGADVPHQLIEALQYLLDKGRDDLPGMTIGDMAKDVNLNPVSGVLALDMARTAWNDLPDAHKFTIRAKTMATAAALVPEPYKTCSFSRLTPKATEYLLSLGRPDPSVVDMFFDHLMELARHSVNQTAEEVIQFRMNDSNTVIYYGCFKDMYFVCLYSDHDASANFFKIIQKGKRNYCDKDDQDGSYYDDFDKSQPFDDLSFVANLWAARETRSFESATEPLPCRKYIAEAVRPRCSKPNFSLYQYVNITSQCERDFNEAKRMVASVHRDVEYRKSIWLTRAYYARRGKNKSIVLNKASVHHRKCAEVSGAPAITVYT